MVRKSGNQKNIQTLCLMVLTGIAISGALFWLRDIMIPFVLAVFCSLTVAPVIDFMQQKWRVPRFLGLVFVLLFGLVLLWVIWIIVSVSFGQMISNAQGYQEQFDGLITRVEAWLPAFSESQVNLRKLLADFMAGKPDALGNSIVSLLSAVTNLLSKGLLVLVFMMFMLAGSPKLASENAREKMGQFVEIFSSARSRVQRYLATKLITSSCTGLLVWLTLWALNIQMAPVFGLLAFLLNFIPNIGSVIATLLPLPVVVMTPDVSMFQAVSAIAIPGAIQFSVGNIIEPRIMGKSLGLHPVAILLALIFWAALWGIIGMLLATPLTAMLKIVLERNSQTEKLAWLISDEE